MWYLKRIGIYILGDPINIYSILPAFTRWIIFQHPSIQKDKQSKTQGKIWTRGKWYDIYDGMVYRIITDPITKHPNNYSFRMNFDGATKWKNSPISNSHLSESRIATKDRTGQEITVRARILNMSADILARAEANKILVNSLYELLKPGKSSQEHFELHQSLLSYNNQFQ